MAVISVTKAMGDKLSYDESGIVLTENYLVVGEATDTPAIAYGAVDPNTGVTIRPYGYSHPTYTYLKVASGDATRKDGELSCVFLVVLVWKSNVLNEQPNNTKWNKRVSSSGVEVVERVNMDVDRLPIRNANGDLYQADLEVVHYDEIITVAYNTKILDGLEDLGKARGRVNDADVTLTITRYGRAYTRTFPAKTLKLGNATWEIDVGPDGDGFFNVSIPLIYRHQLDKDLAEIGWKFQVPNRGERYKFVTGTGSVLLPSKTGIVDLDDDGTKLAPDALQKMIIVDGIDTYDFSTFLSGL